MNIGFTEYNKAQSKLLGRLYGLPKENSLEGFVFYMLTRDVNDTLLNVDKQIRLDKVNQKYTASIEEADELNSGEFANWTKNAYFGFSNELKEFFINYTGHNDFNLLDIFYKAIHFLKNEDDKYAYNEGKVDSNNLNRSYCLSLIKKYKNELIAELEWLIKRINPNNYYSYYPNDEEIKGYYNTIYLKGFRLLNYSRFSENSKDIYDKLTDRFLDEGTSVETFVKLFSGTNELFVEKPIWKGKVNELNYFLKKLNNKLTTGSIFIIGDRLFVKEDGSPFGSDTIKNNRKSPNSYKYIDEIIALF